MNAQSMIAAYNTGFTVCLVITVLAVASAVFLFFKFDIRTIFAIRTGRAERQTIEKLREANARTGTLRPAPEAYTAEGVAAPTAETTPLAQTGQTGAAAAETTPLAQTPAAAPPAAAAAEVTAPLPPGIRFVITENTLIVHTDEVI